MSRALAPAFALLLAALPAAAAEADFDARYAEARANEQAQPAYDESLARHFRSAPGFYARLDACQAHADPQRVHGYFDFAPGTGYRVVARPDTPYGRCIADAHLGYTLPEPPRRPYVHAFGFTPAVAPAQ